MTCKVQLPYEEIKEDLDEESFVRYVSGFHMLTKDFIDCSLIEVSNLIPHLDGA